MRKIQYSIGAILLALALTVTSCGESTNPTAPSVAPVATSTSATNPELLDALTSTLDRTLTTTVATTQKVVGSLLSCTQLQPTATSKVIGPMGGVIHVGPHRLVVPSGALKAPTTISARIYKEKVNRVVFQPHGLEFAKPVALTMSYSNCDLLGRNDPLRVAFTTPGLEIQYYLPSYDQQSSDKVHASVDHFSDYVIAW